MKVNYFNILLFFCNFLQLLTTNELKRSSHRKVQFKLLSTYGDVDINVSVYISLDVLPYKKQSHKKDTARSLIPMSTRAIKTAKIWQNFHFYRTSSL